MSARDNDGQAPLLPGGEPELAGTGPQGAYPDGSPQPGEPVADEPEGVDKSHGSDTGVDTDHDENR